MLVVPSITNTVGSSAGRRGKKSASSASSSVSSSSSSSPSRHTTALQLLFCICGKYLLGITPVIISVFLPASCTFLALLTPLGIYASFLSWGILQERISAVGYGAEHEVFRSPLITNTIQSLFAFLLSAIYLGITTRQSFKESMKIPFNSRSRNQLILVALSQSVSSPLGYFAIGKVDYLVFLLAKSCKILPVIAVHVLVYRRKFPVAKYCLALMITAGVVIFTVSGDAKVSSGSSGVSPSIGSSYSMISGLLLLAASLFLDGLTNSTQDQLFKSNRSLTGPHLMCGLNAVATVITGAYLITSSAITPDNELTVGIQFIRRYPQVLKNIIAYAVFGAVGQLFIFYTLARFGSVVLVTITVTRKMVSMVLSVVWFGHRLSWVQWLGVFLVFGGVAAEAVKTKPKPTPKDAEVVAKAEAEAEGLNGQPSGSKETPVAVTSALETPQKSYAREGL